MSIFFRRFRIGDLNNVIELNKACLPENYTPEFFMAAAKRFPKLFWVAIKDNKLIGYAFARIEEDRRGHIISIAVLPEFRRQGVGTTLVNNIVDWMDIRGIDECYLEVRASNQAAMDFYVDRGFITKNIKPYYYVDGENAVEMVLYLWMEAL